MHFHDFLVSPRTTCSIYYDWNFRKSCFYQKCIGNHADICTKTNKCNTSYLIIDVHCHQFISQIVEPKVSLSIGSVFLRLSSSLLICHPSVSRIQCDTGSFFPSCVSRYHVSWVSRVKERSFEISDFLFYFWNDCDSFFCPKSAINEIILHIYHN